MTPLLVGCWRDKPEIMRRALESAAGHISGVAISVDPRYPQDGEFLRAECDRLNLPAHIYETPRHHGGEWRHEVMRDGDDYAVTGGQLRTVVMREGERFAKELGAEYIVNLDADDHLEFRTRFEWPEGEPVYWLMEHYGPYSYPFKRLFRVGLDWKWYGPIHEEPYCDAVGLLASAPVCEGIRYVKQVDGEREADPVRYARHADICKAWLEEHPKDQRWAYYYAQSLATARKWREAVDAYEAFLRRDDGTPPQRYLAAWEIARICTELGAHPNDLAGLWLRVAQIAPHRAEPYRMLEQIGKTVADFLPIPAGAPMLDANAYGVR